MWKQHKVMPTLSCMSVQVEMCENYWPIGYKSVEPYVLSYLGASKLLFKAWFCYMQLRCKRKIYKEKYRMFAGDSQTLRNKRHFVIGVIAINVFYSSTMIKMRNNRRQISLWIKWIQICKHLHVYVHYCNLD